MNATEMTKQDWIQDTARQLLRLAERLSADVRPGHPDYISKQDAARWAAQLAVNLEELPEEKGTQ